MSIVDTNNIPLENNSSIHLPKLNIEMSDLDFMTFKKYIDQNNAKAFIELYKNKHQELSDNDVISLALMQAVKEGDVFLPDAVVNILCETNNFDPYPLITLDKNGKNAILYTLQNGSCIPNLIGYIYALIENDKINKEFILEGDLLFQIARALKQSPSDTHPTKIIQDIIKPIFTEESVEELIKIVGQDWLNSAVISE